MIDSRMIRSRTVHTGESVHSDSTRTMNDSWLKKWFMNSSEWLMSKNSYHIIYIYYLNVLFSHLVPGVSNIRYMPANLFLTNQSQKKELVIEQWMIRSVNFISMNDSFIDSWQLLAWDD